MYVDLDAVDHDLAWDFGTIKYYEVDTCSVSAHAYYYSTRTIIADW